MLSFTVSGPKIQDQGWFPHEALLLDLQMVLSPWGIPLHVYLFPLCVGTAVGLV